MFFHFRPGVKRYVPLALKPWVVLPSQRAKLAYRCMKLEAAGCRLLQVRMREPALRELLPFSEDEERWIRDSYRGEVGRPETLFSRMDLSADLGRPDWLDRARFLEANLVGIGATYYCWSAGRIAHELFAPRLERSLGFPLAPEDDILEMILRRCRAHGRKIGRPNPTVAFLEQSIEHGPYEYRTMQEIYRERGHRVVVADPGELEFRRGEVTFRNDRIDLLYRDPTLAELVEMEGEGADLRAVRHAFRENRVVSSLAGEVDHKAIFELFTDSRWSRLFTPEERRVFRAHVPWTRLLREATTEGIEGKRIDLMAYVRRERERLLLKPNREYGGSGIAIGSRSTSAEWDRALERGVGRVVVQERLSFLRDRYPVIRDGRVRFEERYGVVGVHAGDDECVILGRMSEEPIVNITRGGAIVGVLVGKE